VPSNRGLVIGKFWPPHRGHSHLIDTALTHADEVWVMVCATPEQSPPGEVRVAWLRELHPRAHVLLVDDRLDADDSRAWAEESLRVLGFRPDVVFTSEEYGDGFAHFLGCRHMLVDRARKAVPVSGTLVRGDPLAAWEFLAPPVRAWYARRIALVGAESTGKTTLVEALARHYGTIWVPEFGREYSERKLAEHGMCEWSSEEFVTIAQTQCLWEDEAARHCSGLLICDTDAFATSIWHERYMGFRSPEVEAVAARHRRPDLYLLSAVAEAPFVQDGTRDGEDVRDWMHQRFIEALTADQRPYVLLTGTLETRLPQAMRAIDDLLSLLP
jgi:HTH-type transcriptional regulator, transcriptional repressor of NAD biosynthesis genes